MKDSNETPPAMVFGLLAAWAILWVATPAVSQGRPSLVDLDAELGQVVDGLCNGDAALCGMTQLPSLGGRVVFDPGAGKDEIDVPLQSLELVIETLGTGKNLIEKLDFIAEASEPLSALTERVFQATTIPSVEVYVPDPVGAGETKVLTFTSVIVTGVEIDESAQERRRISLALVAIQFDWLSSSSSWDFEFNIGSSGCPDERPQISLQGNPASVLDGDEEPTTFDFMVTRPLPGSIGSGGGGPVFDAALVATRTPTRTCLMTTATGAATYIDPYVQLWTRASEFTFPPAKRAFELEEDGGSWEFEKYSILIDGGTVRERLQLDANGQFLMTTRSYDPVNGNETDTNQVSLTFDSGQ